MSERLRDMTSNGPKLLIEIYNEAKGSILNSVDLLKVAGNLGYQQNEAYVFASWLRHKGWLEIESKTKVRLTRQGRNVVRLDSNQGADLPPNYRIHINNSNVVNSNFQNATTNSSQSIVLNGSEMAELSDLVKQIREFLNNDDLRPEVKEDVECELKKIDSQTKSSTPNRERVKGCLTTIKNVIEATSTGAFIVAKIMNFMSTQS